MLSKKKLKIKILEESIIRLYIVQDDELQLD